MNKIIHYCWFGGKPLPAMAKKCIKSWKKFLPDYEIKEWNENNFDIKCCPFVEEAYKNKKWAFVSDYARLHALHEYGGIYLDTDMEIIKDINFLKDKEFFIGYEAKRSIAAGVIGVKNPQNKYVEELLNFYKARSGFSEENIIEFAIPKVITKMFKKYETRNEQEIEVYDNSIYVYPEDYFYPINYDYSKRNYTSNTCMVHYYNATWVPKGEKIALAAYRTFGMKLGKVILGIYYKICDIRRRVLGFIKRRIHKVRNFSSKHFGINKRVKHFEDLLTKENCNNKYIIISHPEWISIGNVAKDKFEYNVKLKEQYTEKEAIKMATKIVQTNVKMVVFNGFAKGWDMVAKAIKNSNKNIKIKILWHGSHSLLAEQYDWESYSNVMELYSNKIVDEIGFVKKSMYDFYKAKGFNVSFVKNNVTIKENYKLENNNNALTKVGLYFSSDRWVKNVYNQLSAVSLIDNVELDCLPINNKIIELAKTFNLQLNGTSNTLEREELFKKMAQNDINIYVTFTECAPLIPLESLELGVPCITGDNHHYFENTELEKYLVVQKEDNIMEIYKQIKICLENKERILELYKEWKAKYDIEADESITQFIAI